MEDSLQDLRALATVNVRSRNQKSVGRLRHGSALAQSTAVSYNVQGNIFHNHEIENLLIFYQAVKSIGFGFTSHTLTLDVKCAKAIVLLKIFF